MIKLKHVVILYILGILFGAVFLDIWGAETNIKKGLIAMFWTALFLVALIFVEKNKEENQSTVLKKFNDGKDIFNNSL